MTCSHATLFWLRTVHSDVDVFVLIPGASSHLTKLSHCSTKPTKTQAPYKCAYITLDLPKALTSAPFIQFRFCASSVNYLFLASLLLLRVNLALRQLNPLCLLHTESGEVTPVVQASERNQKKKYPDFVVPNKLECE